MMERIARYEVQEMLGDGGMGTVYRAIDPRFDRQVAIKVLHQHFHRDDAVADRFRSEAVIQAKLNHPNIVSVFDFVADDDYLAMIMEFVDGISLSDLIRNGGGPVMLERAINIFSQLLKAIGFAHSQGLIHRDIKPSNLMVQKLGDDEVAKVMDFGIAKILGSEKMRTVAGSALGTLAYMAPEQIRNPNLVTPSADIYSLGVSLFETLTGEVPFDADTEYDMMLKIVEQPPEPPSNKVAELPSGVDSVVLRALDKDATKRFQTCADFLGQLSAAAGSGSEVGRDSANGSSWVSTYQPSSNADNGSTQATSTVAPQPRGPEPPAIDNSSGLQESPSSSTNDQRVNEFAGLVGASLAKGSWNEAGETLDRAERTCGDREEFRVLRNLVSEARCRELGEIRRAVEALIDTRDLKGAEKALDGAAERLGDCEELAGLANRCLDLRNDLTASQLVEGFESFLEEGDLERAHENFLELESSFAERVDLVVLKTALSAEKEKRITIAVGEIEDRLTAGELDEAETILEGSVQQLGDHDDLATAAESISEARYDRIADYLTNIRRHMEAGDLEASDRVLAEAALICGIRDEFTVLGDELKGLREEERAVSEAVTRIETELDRNDIDEAQKLLTMTQGLHETNASWQSVRPSLLARLSEERGKWAETVAASALEGELDLVEAIKSIEATLEVDSENARVRDSLSLLKQAHVRAREEERRATVIEQAKESIAELISSGKIDQARLVLTKAEDEIGEALTALSEQIAKAVRELEENAERVRDSLAQARKLRESGNLEAARDELKEALELSSDDEALIELSETLGQEIDDREREKREQLEIFAMTAPVHAGLESGNLVEAERALIVAEQAFGDRPDVKILRKKLESARIDHDRDEDGSLNVEVKKLVADGNFWKAHALLRESASSNPENSEIQLLGDFVRQSEAESAIRSFLDKGDADGAERASKLAEKLFRSQADYREFCERLGI